MASSNFARKRLSKKWRAFGSVCLSSFVPIFLCVATSLFSPTPEADCRLIPLPTGEKVLPATPEATPPFQVSPGQRVKVGFSSGYVFFNYVIQCSDDGDIPIDENTGLGTAHADALAWSEYTQTTRIRLAQSDKECAIELEVPPEESSYAVVCSAGERVGRMRQEVLPRSVYSRTVSVYLDAERPVYLDADPMASTECGVQCTVEFVIPPDTAPGRHKLEFLFDPYLIEAYEIEVVRTDKETP